MICHLLVNSDISSPHLNLCEVISTKRYYFRVDFKEPKANRSGRVIWYIFVQVKAYCFFFFFNCCHRATDWQISLCEMCAPAWLSFNRNAWVGACNMHVGYVSRFFSLIFFFLVVVLIHTFGNVWSCRHHGKWQFMLHWVIWAKMDC